MKFQTTFLPAADVNKKYSQAIVAVEGSEPYTYSASANTLPTGLSLSADGTLFGVPTEIGIYNFIVTVVDSGGISFSALFQFTVMSFTSLSDITVDQSQFVQQFQNVLSKTKTWSVGLTTQTSQTLIELISTIGAFDTSKISRAREDAFAGTAQSDSAVRAIASMQGLRLNRKLPSTVPVSLVASTDTVIPPYTQFSFAGYNWFNSDSISLQTNVALPVVLKEGTLNSYTVTGLGTDLQTWVSVEDNFVVSDQDVQVAINNAVITKTYGGLWNYNSLPAYADGTLNDGRLLIQFGSGGYGAVPGVNDIVTITYPVTNGSSLNGINTTNATVSVIGYNQVAGTATANPSGGADEKSPLAYKNFAAGTFGTYSSAVTKSQYQALVANYPGVIDAVTQAQREINPADLQWMNVFRVCALTNSVWDLAHVNDFIDYLQQVTMYSSRFVWQDPIAIPVDVDISVFCLNSVQSTSAITDLVKAAIEKLFGPRPGILMLDLYISDLVETAMNAAPGQISYVVVNSPTRAMIVTAPPSPNVSFSILPTGGTLTPLIYSYAISVDVPNPDGSPTTEVGTPTKWVFPQVTNSTSRVVLDWTADAVPGAINYHIWGRRGGYIGILATVSGSTTTYTDAGGADPTPEPIPTVADVPMRYNSLNSLTVVTNYAGRQEKAAFPVRNTV